MAHNIDSITQPLKATAAPAFVTAQFVALTKSPPILSAPLIEARDAPQKQKISAFSFAAKVFFALLLLVTAGGFLYLSQAYRLFTVVSGSMEPAIPVGSIAAVSAPQESYAPGDIITFSSTHGATTHRIVEVVQGAALSYRTKGDANPIADLAVVPADQVMGKVKIVLPYLGYVTAWLKTRLGFATLILLPATFVVLYELVNMKNSWRQLRQPALAASTVFTLLIIMILPPASSAYLASAVLMSPNTITTAAIFPTPSPSPSHQPTVEPTPAPSLDCELSVDSHLSNQNTGSGSTNNNGLDINHECETQINNDTTINNEINVNAATGHNQSNGNTSTGNQSSGNINLNLKINNSINNTIP